MEKWELKYCREEKEGQKKNRERGKEGRMEGVGWEKKRGDAKMKRKNDAKRRKEKRGGTI